MTGRRPRPRTGYPNLHSTQSALRDGQGEWTGSIGISRDVSELKRPESRSGRRRRWGGGQLAGGWRTTSQPPTVTAETRNRHGRLRGDEQVREVRGAVKRAGSAPHTPAELCLLAKAGLQPQVVD